MLYRVREPRGYKLKFWIAKRTHFGEIESLQFAIGTHALTNNWDFLPADRCAVARIMIRTSKSIKGNPVFHKENA